MLPCTAMYLTKHSLMSNPFSRKFQQDFLEMWNRKTPDTTLSRSLYPAFYFQKLFIQPTITDLHGSFNYRLQLLLPLWLYLPLRLCLPLRLRSSLLLWLYQIPRLYLRHRQLWSTLRRCLRGGQVLPRVPDWRLRRSSILLPDPRSIHRKLLWIWSAGVRR